jgi:hypothetical protein
MDNAYFGPVWTEHWCSMRAVERSQPELAGVELDGRDAAVRRERELPPVRRPRRIGAARDR